MRPRRWLLAVGFGLMIINRVAALVLPYSTKFLIDTVINKHHMDKLRPLVLVVLAATLVQGVTSFSLRRPSVSLRSCANRCRSTFPACRLLFTT
jgi:subfamily B ATP-binding cassette protein MsbA